MNNDPFAIHNNPMVSDAINQAPAFSAPSWTPVASQYPEMANLQIPIDLTHIRDIVCNMSQGAQASLCFEIIQNIWQAEDLGRLLHHILYILECRHLQNDEVNLDWIISKCHQVRGKIDPSDQEVGQLEQEIIERLTKIRTFRDSENIFNRLAQEAESMTGGDNDEQ